MDEKIDELREMGLRAFMVSGFHPKQLPEIYDRLDESFEFQTRGLRIERDIVGEASQTFEFQSSFPGSKKVLKRLVWARSQDGESKHEESELDYAPFFIEVNSPSDEQGQRMNRAEWDISNRIRVVRDGLNGKLGNLVGAIVGLNFQEFVEVKDLGREIVPQIKGMVGAEGSNVVVRFYSVPEGGSSSRKVPIFNVFTDDRVLEEQLKPHQRVHPATTALVHSQRHGQWTRADAYHPTAGWVCDGSRPLPAPPWRGTSSNAQEPAVCSSPCSVPPHQSSRSSASIATAGVNSSETPHRDQGWDRILRTRPS